MGTEEAECAGNRCTELLKTTKVALPVVCAHRAIPAAVANRIRECA